MRRSATRAVLAATLVAGCIDFVEPDLPERGAPAVLQMTVRLRETQEVEVEARLVPGLDEAGMRRRVPDDRVRVLGRDLAPDSTTRAGTRVYRAVWPASGAEPSGPIEARGPGVAGLAAVPAIRWYTLQRAGPAELELAAGADLELGIDVTEGAAEPAPEIRQWFLSLSGPTQVFRLSSDGPPPARLSVPERWVPGDDSVAVLLVYQQSALVEPPAGGYVGLFTLDTRVAWVVRRTPPAPGPGG